MMLDPNLCKRSVSYCPTLPWGALWLGMSVLLAGGATGTLLVLPSSSAWGQEASQTPQTDGYKSDAEEEADLAKKTQNPVADLISIPIQNNFDFGTGPGHPLRYTANIQPVIPISIGRDWNLITRVITPVIYQESRPGGQSAAGLGDITPTFFCRRRNPLTALFGAPVPASCCRPQPKASSARKNSASVRP